jgi:hypothetical protein
MALRRVLLELREMQSTSTIVYQLFYIPISSRCPCAYATTLATHCTQAPGAWRHPQLSD